MCSLEKDRCIFEEQDIVNSLYFSLLAGNLGGEELARDCALRHTVWVAEKLGCIPANIARNRRNSAIPSPKPDRRKCPAERHTQAVELFSLEGLCTVPFPRLHQSYQGIEVHVPYSHSPSGSLFPWYKFQKLSIFRSYACGSQSEHVCFFLMDRSGDPQPSHLGQQGGSLQSQFGRGTAWSTNDPSGLLKRFHNQSAIRVYQGHRRWTSRETMLSGGHNLRSPFVQRVWEHAVPRKDNRAFY